MSKRAQKAKSKASKTVFSSWLFALASAFLLYLVGKITVSNFSQFRSCDANVTGLTIQNCGKQSFNFGDLLVLVLFALTAALVVSLFTHAWRLSKGSK
jgi:small-conductance mechanosensitive channel